MDESLLFLLVLCVLFTGKNGARHHEIARALQSNDHKISKRQDSILCITTYYSSYCTNGGFQEYADFLLKCNYSNSAQVVRNFCAHSPEGKFCGEYDFQSGINRICYAGNSTCSAECRDYIISSQSKLGCCTSFVLDSSRSLWSLCGVEPITQECSSSTITLHPTKIASTCSYEDLLEGNTTIFCRKQYIEDVQEKISAVGGCQSFFEFARDYQCKANQVGNYCVTIGNKMSSNFTRANTSCTKGSQCEPGCMEALINITDTSGCCFNDRYNTTSSKPYFWWLEDRFWSMCKLKSSGHCELKFTKNTGLQAGAIAGFIVLAIVIFAVLVVVPAALVVMCALKKPSIGKSGSDNSEEADEELLGSVNISGAEEDSDYDPHDRY